jgi:hypothetical protein
MESMHLARDRGRVASVTAPVHKWQRMLCGERGWWGSVRFTAAVYETPVRVPHVWTFTPAARVTIEFLDLADSQINYLI